MCITFMNSVVGTKLSFLTCISGHELEGTRNRGKETYHCLSMEFCYITLGIK